MITVDTVTSGKTTGSQASLTLSHTTAPGIDRLLLVMVLNWATQSQTATYGGVTVPLIDAVGALNLMRITVLALANPPVGTANLVVTPSSNAFVSAGVYGLSGAGGVRGLLQTATAASGTAPTLTVTTALPGDLVIDVVGADANNEVFTPHASQTLHYAQSSLATTDQKSGGSSKAGAASVTMSWTLSISDAWSLGAIAIQPGTTPAATVLAGELDRRTLTTASGVLNATWTGSTSGNWTAGLVALKKT